jgi:ubiquinone biosynthesis protein COQ4
LKGFAVIAAFAARRISRACPGFPIKRAIFNGWRRGRRAAWLVGADWEALLDQPVEAVRAQFAVPPAKYYSEITAALRPAAGAPAADPAPRAPLAA